MVLLSVGKFAIGKLSCSIVSTYYTIIVAINVYR